VDKNEAPRVHAVAEGLLLDGHFIVTWTELDRIRELLKQPSEKEEETKKLRLKDLKIARAPGGIDYIELPSTE
jgi:hypothetical protein